MTRPHLGWVTILTNFLNAQQNAGARGESNALFKGAIGRYHGTDFFVTSNAAIGTSLGLSGADVYYSVFCGRGAVGVSKLNALNVDVIYKEPGSGGATTDPLDQTGKLVSKSSLTKAGTSA